MWKHLFYFFFTRKYDFPSEVSIKGIILVSVEEHVVSAVVSQVCNDTQPYEMLTGREKDWN